MRRWSYGDPRMSANYHDYYEGGGVKVELYYAVDALVFTDIRNIVITPLGNTQGHYPYYSHHGINR